MKTGIYWQDPKYALRPGQGFIFDPSLVLYLPLHRLAGASFMSRDKHGHLCVVTGALWTPRGRSFDGSDDYIDCGNDSILQPSATGELTIEAWIKRGDESEFTIAAKNESLNDAFIFGVDIGPGGADKLNAEINYAGLWFSSDSTIPYDGTWYHVALVVVGGTRVDLFINGILDKHNATANEFQQNTADVCIAKDTRRGNFGKGLIGEFKIYNRALTLLEIQHNCLATKWRYQ